jgi:hypothetical protein
MDSWSRVLPPESLLALKGLCDAPVSNAYSYGSRGIPINTFNATGWPFSWAGWNFQCANTASIEALKPVSGVCIIDRRCN